MQFNKQQYKEKYSDLKIKCIVCNNNIKKHQRITYKQYLKQQFCSTKCRGVWKKKNFVGKNNPNYKHGLSKLVDKLRGCSDYRKWRANVFKRDSWTCQECGKNKCTIHAHHVKSFTYFPKLRFDLNNGITLCKECHSLTDSYCNNKINN